MATPFQIWCSAAPWTWYCGQEALVLKSSTPNSEDVHIKPNCLRSIEVVRSKEAPNIGLDHLQPSLCDGSLQGAADKYEKS